MKKLQILDEIRRTTQANDGQPLGARQFTNATGIKKYDWFGKYWKNWGEALIEAGFARNQLTQAFDEEYLVQKLIEVMQELHPRRFPTDADILQKHHTTPGFPSDYTFRNRLGSKFQRAVKVIAFCSARGGLDDVIGICRTVQPNNETPPTALTRQIVVGSVYLIKHGRNREYKIGHSYDPLRREGEVGIELPHQIDRIHSIETDDPPGVEAYWHRRFAKKRLKGEWFALDADDIAAFKRWRRIN